MNETLKFSWGHIIAFLALIAVGYVSFVGFTYLTDGNFYYAIAGSAATLIIYFFLFLGLQWLKAAGNKIERKIVWERILFCGTPLVFVAFMIGGAHFWSVKTQDDKIVNDFKSSINNSQKMFDDYEAYSEKRIADFDQSLSSILANPTQYSDSYEALGFMNGWENAQKENMLEILRLQLLSDNYFKLKDEALAWINKANNGASTWNVFLIGNTKEIKKAVNNWEGNLKEQSKYKMVGEEIFQSVPDFVSSGAAEAGKGLDEMSNSFNQWKFPVWQAFFFAAIIYFLLLVPYLLQPRHGRQVAAGYTLFKSKKRHRSLNNSSHNKSASSNSAFDTVNNSGKEMSDSSSDVEIDFVETTASVKESPIVSDSASQQASSSNNENKFKQLKKRHLH